MATTTQTAIELLRSRGMRMTPQRIAIVEEIMGTSGYLLPSNVIDHVQARVPGVSASTVYRTLERLEELGALAHVHLEHGLGYHQVSTDTHAHLTCSACGREQGVPGRAAAARALGRGRARLPPGLHPPPDLRAVHELPGGTALARLTGGRPTPGPA